MQVIAYEISHRKSVIDTEIQLGDVLNIQVDNSNVNNEIPQVIDEPITPPHSGAEQDTSLLNGNKMSKSVYDKMGALADTRYARKML